MDVPSPTLRYLRREFRRGRFDEVCGRGDAAGETLSSEPDRAAETAETALLVGAAHAARNRLALAEEYLGHGLDRFSALGTAPTGAGPDTGPPAAGDQTAPWTDVVPSTPPQAPPDGDDDREPAPAPPPPPPPPIVTAVPGWPPPPTPAPWRDPQAGPAWAPPPPPPPPGPLPPPPWAPGAEPWAPPPWEEPAWPLGRGRGGPGRSGPWPGASYLTPPPPPRRAPFVDWCGLLLGEVHVRTGRTAAATARFTALAEPHNDAATRFAATRGQALLATLAGDHERAHHLLNTAAGLAARVPSRFRATLVERDRAVVLARQRRLREALALAERVLEPLVRPVTGRYQRWSRTEGAALALELARRAALAGDDTAAHQLLDTATEALRPLGHGYLAAHLLLASAVVQGTGADAGGSEELLARAGALFELSGDRSAAALVLLEHGRVAHRRGLERSARPLYVQAGAELRACGLGDDAREPDELLAALDAGRPPQLHRTR